MGRVAVVTGGTRGIGRAISNALKNAGYRVAATYGGNDKAAQQFNGETGIPVVAAVIGRDLVAGILQADGDRPADAARPAGDHRHPGHPVLPHSIYPTRQRLTAPVPPRFRVGRGGDVRSIPARYSRAT